MKGTMSEMELSLFRQRSLEALKQKARRGELFLTVAVGYLKITHDRIEKDPDRRVQEAIALVFAKQPRAEWRTMLMPRLRSPQSRPRARGPRRRRPAGWLRLIAGCGSQPNCRADSNAPSDPRARGRSLRPARQASIDRQADASDVLRLVGGEE